MLGTWVVIDWPVWQKPVGTVHNTCLNQDMLIESLLKWVFTFRAPLTPIWILFDCEKTDGGDGQGGRSDWLGTKGWWSPGLVVKNPPVNAGNTGDPGSIPRAGRYPGGGPGNWLQYSCLEHPMDMGAWRATVNGVIKSQTQLKWLSTH